MQQAIFVLNKTDTIANQFIAELRDRNKQLDRARFRRNLVKLGAVLAYEISKSLKYHTIQVQTVLGDSKVNVLQQPPVLYTVIRAGLPFLEGFQQFFDQSDCGFVGAYRIEDENEISVSMGYQSMAPFHHKDLIIVDPMLATGTSLVTCAKAILEHGTPRSLHFAAAIASPEGIDHLNQSISPDYGLWAGVVDPGLNDQGYIVPGLGDAGDLLYGSKID